MYSIAELNVFLDLLSLDMWKVIEATQRIIIKYGSYPTCEKEVITASLVGPKPYVKVYITQQCLYIDAGDISPSLQGTDLHFQAVSAEGNL